MMKMLNFLTALASGSRRKPDRRFPNMNLLPRDLAHPVVSTLGIIMILFMAAGAGGSGALQMKAIAREKAIAASRTQLDVLSRGLSQASAVREEATRVKNEIAVLEESPKLYLQLVGHFDRSAILQTLLSNTPAGVELMNLQGRGQSLVIQARADPQVALEYYQTLRGLPVFSSVIIRFVSAPDPGRPADFSMDIVIKGPPK